MGSWCPWGEQLQGKVKGRGQSALEKRGSERVESAGRPHCQDCQGGERMGEIFSISTMKVAIVILCLQRRRVQRDEIICPFLHYYNKQRPPLHPNKGYY